MSLVVFPSPFDIETLTIAIAVLFSVAMNVRPKSSSTNQRVTAYAVRALVGIVIMTFLEIVDDSEFLKT